METLLEKQWHHRPVEDLMDLLGSHPEKGLDLLEVQARREQFGPNLLTPKKTHGPLVRFLLQFRQPLVLILIAAGVVTGLIAEWSDASVILAVVLINAIIGYVQETKAAGAIEALSRSMTTTANTVRGGRMLTVPFGGPGARRCGDSSVGGPRSGGPAPVPAAGTTGG